MIQGSNMRIQKAILKAKKNWIGIQWEENRNNNKRAYQLVKILTSEKRCKSTGILDKSGNVLQRNNRFSADGQYPFFFSSGPILF